MKIPHEFVSKLHSQILSNLNMYFSEFLPVRESHDGLWPLTLTEECIIEFEVNAAEISRKYFMATEGLKLNPLNSDHMAMFLYLLSRKIITKLGYYKIADSISYLNKIMHGIDVWHTVVLPKNFIFVHPVGTVLGKASYSDFIAVYQGVTVGSSTSKYPTFDGPVVLYSNVSILGDCYIGKNTVIGANTMLIDKKIPPDSNVWNSKELVIQQHFEDIKQKFMRDD
jgi:serine O-acetyltransferase